MSQSSSPPVALHYDAGTYYEVIDELGAGGMGRVQLAKAIGIGGFERLVVLKRIHEHLIEQPGFLDRFLDEARLSALVHHANVVGVQNTGEDAEGFYLVLDYIEGETLFGLLDGARDNFEPVAQSVLLKVFVDALAGLHAIHEACDPQGEPLEILHRDVSPDNLLIGRDGTTRIADLGIAKQAALRGHTQTGKLMGKPLYMAPEYLLRKPCDRRVDIYATGVSLWIALTDRHPWPGADEPQIVAMALNQGLPRLSEIDPSIPVAISEVVAIATARDVEERYPSAHAMAAALSTAARSTCGLADRQTVTAELERLLGAHLEARRQRIADFGPTRLTLHSERRHRTAPVVDAQSRETRPFDFNAACANPTTEVFTDSLRGYQPGANDERTPPPSPRRSLPPSTSSRAAAARSSRRLAATPVIASSSRRLRAVPSDSSRALSAAPSAAPASDSERALPLEPPAISIAVRESDSQPSITPSSEPVQRRRLPLIAALSAIALVGIILAALLTKRHGAASSSQSQETPASAVLTPQQTQQEPSLDTAQPTVTPAEPAASAQSNDGVSKKGTRSIKPRAQGSSLEGKAPAGIATNNPYR